MDGLSGSAKDVRLAHDRVFFQWRGDVQAVVEMQFQLRGNVIEFRGESLSQGAPSNRSLVAVAERAHACCAAVAIARASATAGEADAWRRTVAPQPPKRMVSHGSLGGLLFANDALVLYAFVEIGPLAWAGAAVGAGCRIPDQAGRKSLLGRYRTFFRELHRWGSRSRV
jgi:hypothetical protein